MSAPRRLALGALLLGTVALGATVLLSGGGGYRLQLELADAGGLLEGANVHVDGVPVGKVSEVELDQEDQLTAELRIDEQSVVPVHDDARAVIQVDGVFGDRFVDLDRGEEGGTMPSGGLIPRSRTSVSVRADDVIDAADLPTRKALGLFLRSQGEALVGRGHDLGEVLAALPPTLTSTGELLREFAHDNRALGRLIEQSDRILASVARERRSLGRLVGSAGEALDTLASRRRELGETVRRAPDALASTRRALVSLQGAAVPLIPAARGLRETAPPLTETLRELPGFADAAIPTLATVREVAPELQRLGRRGAPLVRRLRPLARELATYGAAADPATETLDQAAADLLGVTEGWARSTQPKDAASHIFRFGVSTSSEVFESLALILELDQSRGAQKGRTGRAARDAEDRPRSARPGPGDAEVPDAEAPGRPDSPVPGLDLHIPGLDLGQPQGRQSGVDGGGARLDGIESLLNFMLDR